MLSETVDIIAGSGDNISLPMKIYTSKAHEIPFFDKCLSAGFREGEEKVIRLPDDDPRAVEMLLEFLVFNKLPSRAVVNGKYGITLATDTVLIMTDLLILGDKLGSEAFQNTVMDHIRRMSREFLINPKHVDNLDRAGARHLKGYEFLVAQLIFDLQSKFDKYKTKFEGGFNTWVEGGGEAVKDVLEKLATRWSDNVKEPCTGTQLDDWCKWHTHSTTLKCTKTPRVEFYKSADDDSDIYIID